MLQVICITPVKNESWVIDNFLSKAIVWADRVIVADQQSSDQTSMTLKKYTNKVTAITNKSKLLDEFHRRNILLREARKVSPRKKMILAIDADEMLSVKKIEKKLLRKLDKLKPGTMITMDWVNIHPDLKHCWVIERKIFGFIDDGYSMSDPGKIHTERVPTNNSNNIFHIRSIKVIHLQYIDWMRMQAKHRWYMLWEMINNPGKSIINIYRQYNHMYSINPRNIYPISKFFTMNKLRLELENLRAKSQSIEYWWNRETENLLSKHNVDNFALIDENYRKRIAQHSLVKYYAYKLLSNYLRITQRYHEFIGIKYFDELLSDHIKLI